MNWFHAIPPRQNSGSLKNNMMQEDNPHLPKDIVPFSAADMEFKNAPEIIQAIKDFLDSEKAYLHITANTPDMQRQLLTGCCEGTTGRLILNGLYQEMESSLPST